MAQFDTGADTLTALLRRAGDLLPDVTSTSGADHLIDAKLYINKAYREIIALKPWRWARKRLSFNSTGKIDVSANSIVGSTVTLSANITPSVSGRKFFMNSDGIPFRITAHTAGTAILTLETSYTGTTLSGSGMVFLDEIFVASDILAFPIITELHWGDEIIMVSEGEALSEFPRNIYGAPRAMYGTWITPDTIRIMPWTFDDRHFECAYNKRPAALDFLGGAVDTPIVPQDSRVVILQRALEMVYTDKRDGRLTSAQSELRETLGKMGTIEATFIKPRIHIPRGFRVAP